MKNSKFNIKKVIKTKNPVTYAVLLNVNAIPNIINIYKETFIMTLLSKFLPKKSLPI